MLTYNFNQTVRGDSFGVLTTEGMLPYRFRTSMDLTGASIKMEIRSSIKATSALKTITSEEDGGIVIDGAGDPYEGTPMWDFHIVPFILDVQAGNLLYDIQLTLSNDSVYTLVGGLVPVLNDVTR